MNLLFEFLQTLFITSACLFMGLRGLSLLNSKLDHWPAFWAMGLGLTVLIPLLWSFVLLPPKHPSLPNLNRQSDVNELQKKLNEAMQALSDDHRAVVTMFDIQGLPHAEISKILSISEGTVRSRLHYAHRHLQSLLAEFKNESKERE